MVKSWPQAQKLGQAGGVHAMIAKHEIIIKGIFVKGNYDVDPIHLRNTLPNIIVGF